MAILNYSQAIKLAPDNAEVYYDRAALFEEVQYKNIIISFRSMHVHAYEQSQCKHYHVYRNPKRAVKFSFAFRKGTLFLRWKTIKRQLIFSPAEQTRCSISDNIILTKSKVFSSFI